MDHSPKTLRDGYIIASDASWDPSSEKQTHSKTARRKLTSKKQNELKKFDKHMYDGKVLQQKHPETIPIDFT